MSNNGKDGFFSDFKEGLKGPLGIVGFVAGFGILTYTFALIAEPEKTIKSTKDVFTGLPSETSISKVDLPDCETEVSKEVKVSGKKYTISCTP